VIPFITAACLLGLSSGFSPGPLLTLVIAQTVMHGVKEGIKVALAPLITDALIITVAVSVLSRFARVNAVLGWISICGGLFVVYLAWETFRAPGPGGPGRETGPVSQQGNSRQCPESPSVHLLVAVGAPMMVRAREESLAGGGRIRPVFLHLSRRREGARRRPRGQDKEGAHGKDLPLTHEVSRPCPFPLRPISLSGTALSSSRSSPNFL
jgi:hypothetical protein